MVITIPLPAKNFQTGVAGSGMDHSFFTTSRTEAPRPKHGSDEPYTPFRLPGASANDAWSGLRPCILSLPITFFNRIRRLFVKYARICTATNTDRLKWHHPPTSRFTPYRASRWRTLTGACPEPGITAIASRDPACVLCPSQNRISDVMLPTAS